MGFSITQQPSTYLQSAVNDSFFTVSSSNIGQASFRYRADIYVNGSILTTQKISPDPNLGFGTFNLKEVAPSFPALSYDFPYQDASSSIFYLAPNSYCSVSLSFGEEFIGLNGGFTQSINLVASNNFSYINSSIDYLTFQNTDLSNYLLDGSSVKDYLTNAPVIQRAYNNLRQFLYFFNSAGNVNYADITTFDVYGNVIGTYSIPNPNSGSSGLQIVSVGIPQLKLLPTSSYIINSGPTQIIGSNIGYYTVFLAKLQDTFSSGDLLADSSGDYFIDGNGFRLSLGNSGSASQPVGETVQYNVSQDQSNYTPYGYQVFFLNPYAGFDSFLFNKKSETTQKKTQNTFKRIQGQLNSNGTYTTNTYSPSVVPFYTELQDSIDLNTDFLNDEEASFLVRSLHSSPVIFIQDYNGILFSATCKTEETKIYQRVNQKIFNVTFTFEPSFQNYRQQL